MFFFHSRYCAYVDNSGPRSLPRGGCPVRWQWSSSNLLTWARRHRQACKSCLRCCGEPMTWRSAAMTCSAKADSNPSETDRRASTHCTAETCGWPSIPTSVDETEARMSCVINATSEGPEGPLRMAVSAKISCGYSMASCRIRPNLTGSGRVGAARSGVKRSARASEDSPPLAAAAQRSTMARSWPHRSLGKSCSTLRMPARRRSSCSPMPS
mmetsp:Transcript_13247/g.38537  ORF Transcript_13247/g.38537 Transcript_13247/m.38537 type:complete len:212 (-) Transcript_13247:398-1033(-)